MTLAQLQWHMALLLSQHLKFTEIMTKKEMFQKLNGEGWYWDGDKKAWLPVEGGSDGATE